MNTITQDPDTLTRDAATATGDCIDRAVANIDGQFGDGYAEDNPELVAAFLQAAAINFAAAVIASRLDKLADTLDVSDAIEQAAATVADAIADK